MPPPAVQAIGRGEHIGCAVQQSAASNWTAWLGHLEPTNAKYAVCNLIHPVRGLGSPGKPNGLLNTDLDPA